MNLKETYNICDSLPEVVQKNKTNVIDLYDIIGNFTGNFVIGKYYNHRDIVVYDGSQYYCIAEGFTATKTPDTDSDNWVLYLAKGQTGSVGTTGAKGDTGTSVVTIENKGTSQGEGYTITHCETVLSDGTRETFDVQAKDGAKGDKGDKGDTGPQGPQGTPGTIDPSSLRGAVIIDSSENQKLSFVDVVDQDLTMLQLQNSDGTYVTEHSSKGVSVKNNSLQEAVSVNYDHIQLYSNGSVKQYLHEGNVKTLFGNQSIYGSGNIDLYRHIITLSFNNSTFSGLVRIEHISSNNLKVDSLTDLYTLMKNIYNKQVYGAIQDVSGYIGSFDYVDRFDSNGQIYGHTNDNSSVNISFTSVTVQDDDITTV